MDESLLAGNPGPLGIYSDDAKRLSDSYNIHALMQANWGRWLAVRISDGVVHQDTVYDTRADAERIIGPFSSLYFYTRILPTGMNPQAASVMLNYNRKLYAEGARMPAPSPLADIPGRKWEMFN